MRDLRDPQLLGASLISDTASVRNVYGADIPMSEVYDGDTGNYVKGEVSKDDSMGKQCVREYRAELEERAAGGDKYAQSALDQLNKGGRVEGFDPAGA